MNYMNSIDMESIALQLAHNYLEIVFNSGKMEDLSMIIHNDLQFDGPLFTFSNRQSYIDSMVKQPPQGFKYEIMNEYGDENSAFILYQFSKPGISTPMAQHFQLEDKKIKRITLLFDSTKFL